jgi:hypothetical protein
MYRHLVFGCAALVLALALACGKGTPAPTSPTGAAPGTGDVVGPGATLKVTAPSLESPINDAVVEDLDPDVIFGHAVPLHSSSAIAFQYDLEVYDEDGGLAYSRSVSQGSGSTTTHELAEDLDANERHTWRVRARLQLNVGTFFGPWSPFGSFKTEILAPAGLLGIGPSCASAGTPIGIVECRRAQWDHMQDEDLPVFLKSIAFDLNRAGIPGGPWGVLQKTIGGNCHGYSCDIICSGQGDDQNQFDVLQDAEGDQIPHWAEVGEGLVPRFCEIIQ